MTVERTQIDGHYFIQGEPTEADTDAHLNELRRTLAGFDIELDQIDRHRFTLQTRRDELQAKIERIEAGE